MVLVWVQLSPSFSVIVFKTLVQPVLARVAQVVPAPAQVESNVSACIFTDLCIPYGAYSYIHFESYT